MSETRRLDTSRPYGIVHGMQGGAAYWQDGMLFRYDHTLFEREGAVATEPPERGEEDKTVVTEPPERGEEDFAAVVRRMAAEGKTPKEIWRELGVHHTKVLSVLN